MSKNRWTNSFRGVVWRTASFNLWSFYSAGKYTWTTWTTALTLTSTADEREAVSETGAEESNWEEAHRRENVAGDLLICRWEQVNNVISDCTAPLAGSYFLFFISNR